MIQALNDISLCLSCCAVMHDFPRGITSRPALVLVKLGNEVLARAEDPLAALGLSGRQYLILAVLGTDEPSSQLDLASLCGLLPAQVVPVLDELERRGLVARQRSEQDRRRSVVRLTPAGEEMLAKGDELARSIEETLFGDLDADARERLNETLRAGLARARPGLADAAV
jgi:DNA-binding MarR family transcriptional regulator